MQSAFWGMLKKYKEIQNKRSWKNQGELEIFYECRVEDLSNLLERCWLAGWLAIKITFDVTSHSRKYAETPGSTEWLGECRESTRLNVQQGMSYKMT